jgi:hypothetical protein
MKARIEIVQSADATVKELEGISPRFIREILVPQNLTLNVIWKDEGIGSASFRNREGLSRLLNLSRFVEGRSGPKT